MSFKNPDKLKKKKSKVRRAAPVLPAVTSSAGTVTPRQPRKKK
ncbi:MAG: hypothetical protein ACYC5K_02170 [Saccharofermentanales bacterium]